jgi:hypothetical protein
MMRQMIAALSLCCVLSGCAGLYAGEEPKGPGGVNDVEHLPGTHTVAQFSVKQEFMLARGLSDGQSAKSG